MLRVVENRGGVALFDNRTVLHDRDAVRNLRHHAEIVRDEQNRRLLALLQIPDQGQDLRLRGNVERGGGFVRDQESRIERKRHRDHGALALATRQFMRIGARGGFRIGDAHVFEQRQHPGADRGAGQVGMDRKHLADLIADAAQRIERGHRLLEDHRDAGAAHPPHFRGGGRRQIAAFKHHPAAIDGHLARQ